MVGLNENDEKGFGSEGRFLSTDPFDMILDYDQGRKTQQRGPRAKLWHWSSWPLKGA